MISPLQLVLLLPILALVTAWLYIQWAFKRQLQLARKLPTATPAYPLIGNLIDMSTKYKVGNKTWKLGLGHRSGLSCVWLGPVPWLMINKPEYVKVVLNNSCSLGKSKMYEVQHFALGKGLITAPVNLWKVSRKHINPIFQSENLYLSMPIFNETARHLVEHFSEHVGKDIFDCENYLFSLSSVNIFKLLFGPDFEIDRKFEMHKDMFNEIKILPVHLGERIYNPLLRSNIIFKLLRTKSLHNIKSLRKHLKELTEKSRDVNVESVESNEKMERAKVFKDIYNVLKYKDSVFNEEYMLDELTTLLMTGTGTSAITLSSCLVALGSNPDIQEKLYDEITSVVGEASDINTEDIAKMTYLDQVLKETLRYFSIAPLSGRKCDSDIQLGEYTIPKGTTVIISYLGLNNNEEVFPDPLRFDPDRFSPDNVSKRHSYSCLPFSGGPRNCIGKNYAMLAMKITLIHLLKTYEIKSNMDIQNFTYRYRISMISVDGYKISITKRI